MEADGGDVTSHLLLSLTSLHSRAVCSHVHSHSSLIVLSVCVAGTDPSHRSHSLPLPRSLWAQSDPFSVRASVRLRSRKRTRNP